MLNTLVVKMFYIRWPKYWNFRTKSTFKIGRTDSEAEVPILWPPDAKSRLFRKKTPMLGKIKGGKRKG